MFRRGPGAPGARAVWSFRSPQQLRRGPSSPTARWSRAALNCLRGLYLSRAARKNRQRLPSCAWCFRGMDHPLTSPDVRPATPAVVGPRLPLEVIEWMAALTVSST